MLIDNIYLFIVKVAAASVLIPIFFCIKHYKALSKSMRALFIYLFICLISDIAGIYLADKGRNNNFVLNSFTVIETGMLLAIYYAEFKAFIEARKLFLTATIVYLLFIFIAVLEFGFRKGINETDNVLNTIETFIFLISSGIYLIHLANGPSDNKLAGFFYINFGVFMYFCASFTLFLESKYFDESTHLEASSRNLAYVLWGINLFVNVLKNLLFAVGINKENG